jgi:hypothetical protein
VKADEHELADWLALELNTLEGCNVRALDVLAALAATGLKLVRDPGDEAYLAYKVETEQEGETASPRPIRDRGSGEP